MKARLFVVMVLIGATGLFLGSLVVKKSLASKSAPFRVNAKYLERDGAYSIGPKNARVTIVEFFDPECEACREMNPIMERLEGEFAGKIQIVHRYMLFHENSKYAAAILEEAKQVGKYKEALELIFEHQPKWGSHKSPRPDLIPTFLKSLGLASLYEKPEDLIQRHQPLFSQDTSDGEALMVKQTPTFFVNGRPIFSIGYEPLKTAINEELERTPSP